MKHETSLRCLWVVFTGCTIGIASCSDRRPVTPVAQSNSSSTADEVCKITAELLAVDRSKINVETSLGDLGADELDFVELVMALEEHFNITIPDATAEQMLGTGDWQQGMKNVTMAKLVSVIDERKRAAKDDKPQRPHAARQRHQSIYMPCPPTSIPA